MKKEIYEKNKNKYFVYFKGFILEILVTALFIFLFAFVMYFTESGFKYAPIFATVSIALGSFAASFYTAKKIGSRGFIVGLIIGGITFLIITLVSLIVDEGAVTVNTLFHLIIIMLSSLIGGIMGVNNSRNKKYI